MVAFLGASYFRAVGGEMQYGLSARGLAIDTGLARPEEFPSFTAFWLERPAPESGGVTVYALLDSPSATGAYRFAIFPGATTVMDVDAAIYPRKPIERLGIVWPDRVSYQSMWSQHPAFVDGIGPHLERNLLADLVEVDGGFRTAVDEEAVRYDGRELLADDEVRTLLDRREQPTTIVRAEYGMFGTPPPMIAAEHCERYAQHRWIEGHGLNHYTVMTSAAGATLVADALRSVITRP